MNIVRKLICSVLFGIISCCFLISCSEEDVDRDFSAARMYAERAGFKNIKLKVFEVPDKTKDLRSYYNGSYYFTNIIKEYTLNYFIANPDMIGTYKEDSSYSFTVSIYATTDVLLQNAFKGHQYYYELFITEMGTDNAVSDGMQTNPGNTASGSINNGGGGLNPSTKK